jgi:hypothetical protein
MKTIVWSPAPTGVGLEVDTSENADQPWCRLNQDYQHGQIPIPGLVGMYAESVRGVMEGLRIIGPVGKPGKINPGYFVGPGRFRPTAEGQWFTGYSFNGDRIDPEEAHRRIFVPACLWVIENKCHDVVAKLRMMAAREEQQGSRLVIHDGLRGFACEDANALCSTWRGCHVSLAAVLVAYLTGNVGDSVAQ